MLLWIWTRNDASGLLDDEFRDGDVFHTAPDDFEPSIGNQEKKSFLIIKIPDPPNMARVSEDLVRPEYAAGPSADANVIRRQRLYSLDWRPKFALTEIEIIEDPNQMLPDGTLLNGGTVTSGVVSGVFVIGDLSRK